jgi:hypothetical protein
MAWLVALAAFVMLMVLGNQFQMDPSYETAEMNRFETSRLLGPVAVMSDAGEMNRFEATQLLGAVAVISDAGEMNRFEATQLLVPEVLSGYDYVEFNRFQALQDLTPTT